MATGRTVDVARPDGGRRSMSIHDAVEEILLDSSAIASRVRTARSRGHERFPFSRPCDDAKWVHSSPQSAARSLITSTNRRSLPAVCTASAIAASLPDTISSPFRSVSRRTRFPRGSSPMPEPE